MVYNHKEYMKRYNGREEIKEKHRLYFIEYRKTEKCKICSKKYRQTEKFRLQRKKYRQTEEYKFNQRELMKRRRKTEHGKKYEKEYMKRIGNTIRGRQCLRRCVENRRAMHNNIIHQFTIEEWTAKLNATNGICPACQRYVGIDKLTMDHIYAVIRAYNDFLATGVKRVYGIGDVMPLCKSCNSSKGAKLPSEWKAQ